jgi:Tfp pilus assembly protein PilX
MKKIKTLLIQSQKGIAAIYITFLVLTVVFTIAINISILTHNEQRITRNIVKSSQAYFASEAGLEDILLRVTSGMNWSNSYTLNVGDNTTSIVLSDIIGGIRTITSTGDASNRTRKVQAIYKISTDEISFYYGAQIGEGGMVMDNNTWVRGNVFSNGTVSSKVVGAGSIEESIVVAGNGNKIIGLNIGKDAKAFTCEDSVIGGTLTYVSSGGAVQNCTAGDLINEQPNEILPKDLPISQNQIDEWKQAAEDGGVIVGDYTIPINETRNIGPQKIEGNLVLNNGSVLNMTGTVWVTGSITINNGSVIKLDPSSYGLNSGIIIADGTILAKPGIVLTGSGSNESYLLLLSTNSSLDFANPAINIENNTEAAIFYANQGIITLSNNIEVREVTAYKVYLKNNTEIIYEAGLENASFSSGPGGSWEVISWKEIE